jgi:uncharacterized protein (TIGR00251 family)
MSAPFLREHSRGTLLALKVQPRATRTELGEALGAELKLRVAAPPVDDAANEEVVRFLARALDLPKGAVQLIRGRTSRHKVLLLTGLEPAIAAARLGAGT